MAGSKIMFFNATRHHSGIYNCSADNGFSRPLPPTASKTIILDVHRKLTMSKHFLKKHKELKTLSKNCITDFLIFLGYV